MNDSERERGETQNNQAPPGVPAWVKISGAVVAVLVIVVIAVLLVGGGGGGEHGPGRHGAAGAVTPDVTRSALSAGALG
jgi:hypothetical protein